MLARNARKLAFISLTRIRLKVNQVNEFKNEKGEIDREGIKKIIPYQEPFLFIDTVTSLNSNRIVAVKELKGSEDFFKGHFVGFPIMPGALTMEGIDRKSTRLHSSHSSISYAVFCLFNMLLLA